MMRVSVKLHATLKKHLPAGAARDGIVLELVDGSTVGDVIARLGIPPKHAGMLVSGDAFVDVMSQLKDGQELNIFPPMAGGAC